MPKPFNVGFVGVGGFIQAIHLPNMAKLPEFRVRALAKQSGGAEELGKQYGADYVTTSYDKVIEDPEVDVVVIGTRHKNHAELFTKCCENHKHILIEKPVAMTYEGCKEILEARRKAPDIKVCVGFNRRYAPLAVRIKDVMLNRPRPVMIAHQWMDEGLGAWAYDPEEGGGRIISSMCHIFDIINWWVASMPVRIWCEEGAKTRKEPTQDNAIVTVRYASGDIATVISGDLGANQHIREQSEIYMGDGKVMHMVLYHTLRFWGFDDAHDIYLENMDKGTPALAKEFARDLLEDRQPRSNEYNGVMSTIMARKAIDSIRTGEPQTIEPGECGLPADLTMI